MLRVALRGRLHRTVPAHTWKSAAGRGWARAYAYCDAAAKLLTRDEARRDCGEHRPYPRLEHRFLPHSAPHICRGLRKSGMAQCGLATIIESWLSSV